MEILKDVLTCFAELTSTVMNFAEKASLLQFDFSFLFHPLDKRSFDLIVSQFG